MCIVQRDAGQAKHSGQQQVVFSGQRHPGVRGVALQPGQCTERQRLRPAFHIFNRYQDRLLNRLNFSLQLLDQELASFDFEVEETIEIDRERRMAG